jgi:hypothetical protein
MARTIPATSALPPTYGSISRIPGRGRSLVIV